MPKRKRHDIEDQQSEDGLSEDDDLDFLQPPMKKRKLDLENPIDVVQLLNEMIYGDNRKLIREEVRNNLEEMKGSNYDEDEDDDEDETEHKSKYVMKFKSKVQNKFKRYFKELDHEVEEFSKERDFHFCCRRIPISEREEDCDCNCHYYADNGWKPECSACTDSWMNYQFGIFSIKYVVSRICDYSVSKLQYGAISKVLDVMISKISDWMNYTYEKGDELEKNHLDDVEYDTPRQIRRGIMLMCKKVRRSVTRMMKDPKTKSREDNEKIRNYFRSKLEKLQSEINEVHKKENKFEKIHVLLDKKEGEEDDYEDQESEEEEKDEEDEYEKDMEESD